MWRDVSHSRPAVAGARRTARIACAGAKRDLPGPRTRPLSRAARHSARKNLSRPGQPRDAAQTPAHCPSAAAGSREARHGLSDEAGGNSSCCVGPSRGAPLHTEHPGLGLAHSYPELVGRSRNCVLSQIGGVCSPNASEAPLMELIERGHVVRFPCTHALLSLVRTGPRKSETISPWTHD
jgi:hypothetical protein